MKRTLTILTILLLTAMTAWASPAYREPITITQPDGTHLTVWMHGDELHHWLETADGTLVVNTQQGCFVAALDGQGQLRATATLAHEPVLRSTAERQLVARQTEPLRTRFHERGLEAAAANSRRAQISETAHYVPHTGSPRILVILTAYSDKDFIVPDPVKTFDQYLNGETLTNLGNKEDKNAYSVRKYFDICSGGRFTPQFDVVGPVTLPNTLEFYGGTSDTPNDEKFSTLGTDALNLVKDQVDLKLYDNDGDGAVELVYVIHAGYGQNTSGIANTMWAKVSYANLNIDGTTVSRLGCNSELFRPKETEKTDINGIGTFCHEFSHAMGMPDLYPTSTPPRTVNNQAMEFWSVMDYGLYRKNGYDPTPYNAWEREAMGWQQAEVLSETTRGITMKTFFDGGQSYKIVNSNYAEEAFYIENIQKKGANANAYGHGMMVYHIDYAYSTVNMSDYPNNTKGHPRVTVVPADGLFISSYLLKTNVYGGSYEAAEYLASLAGDPFPGTSGTTEVSDHLSVPNYMYYNGTGATGVALKNITEDTEAGTVTFDFVTIAKGDINADEHIDAADVVAITDIITGKDAQSNTTRADVNGDSKVDISDVVNAIGLTGREPSQ